MTASLLYVHWLVDWYRQSAHLSGKPGRRHLLLLRGTRLPCPSSWQTWNDFKSVNDTFGHNAGDRVLQAFATLLMENSREEDLIARWGGEEFMMMLPGTSATEATFFWWASPASFWGNNLFWLRYQIDRQFRRGRLSARRDQRQLYR